MRGVLAAPPGKWASYFHFWCFVSSVCTRTLARHAMAGFEREMRRKKPVDQGGMRGVSPGMFLDVSRVLPAERQPHPPGNFVWIDHPELLGGRDVAESSRNLSCETPAPAREGASGKLMSNSVGSTVIRIRHPARLCKRLQSITGRTYSA